MKLSEYLNNRKITLRQMREGLVAMFGNSPTHTTLHHIAAGLTEPKLELALMILRWSNSEIKPNDLLIDTKRKYTSVGSAIYVVEKEIKTIKERLADPQDEVHEIDDEDLSAAADYLDRLLDEL